METSLKFEQMLRAINERLRTDDDAELWRVVLERAASCFEAEEGFDPESSFLVIGSCSHWLRPHQTRWTAAGGFAFPAGYVGASGVGRHGRPELDWKILFRFDPPSNTWQPVEKFAGKRRQTMTIAVPARTSRHQQSALNIRWQPSNKTEFWGFRRIDEQWQFVAGSHELTNENQR